MKKTRIAVTAFFTLIVVFAWAMKGLSFAREIGEYNKYCSDAEAYATEKLYQKAINSYENALLIRYSAAVRNKQITQYRLGNEDGVISNREYADALLVACKESPKNSDYWVALLNLYLDDGNYIQANRYYNRAISSGARSDAIAALRGPIKYSYSLRASNSRAVFYSPTGLFTVQRDEHWGVMNSAGEWIFEPNYQYISPVSSDGFAVFTSDTGTVLMNMNGVIEGYVRSNASEFRAYGDGLIPAHTSQNKWSYYDVEGDKKTLGDYEEASSFAGGIAAVKQNGKWKLIDCQGNVVCDTVFDDIKLYEDGSYTYRGGMVASVNGSYNLYSAKGELETEWSASDADVYLGGWVAFCDATGKWGYVDTKGNITVPPEYDEAKSFCTGVGAVEKEGRWGYIDETSQVVIPCQFRFAGYMSNGGVAFVGDGEGDIRYSMLKLRF